MAIWYVPSLFVCDYASDSRGPKAPVAITLDGAIPNVWNEIYPNTTTTGERFHTPTFVSSGKQLLLESLKSSSYSQKENEGDKNTDERQDYGPGVLFADSKTVDRPRECGPRECRPRSSQNQEECPGKPKRHK
jgi:hypothetical protein